MQCAFQLTLPIQEFSGKVDVGNYAAVALLGEAGGRVMNALIACALLATVSSYTVLAPRVWKVMGDDSRFCASWRFLPQTAHHNGHLSYKL